MKSQIEKNAGTALILGAIMITVTMILHPAGGDIEHLLKISKTIIITHSLAILSIPIMFFGFWGLTKQLNTNDTISVMAFIIMSCGLFAAMWAAAINGLALPLFIENYKGASPEKIETIQPILSYGFTLNKAMDYIFIVACCIAVLLWSVIIIKKSIFPKWVGYFGLVLGLGAVISLLSSVVFTNLLGFRIFIFGLVSWILTVGYLLRRLPSVMIGKLVN